MSATWIDFKAIRQQVRMIDLLRHYHVDLRIKGDQATGLCPLPGHPSRQDGQRRTPSLSVHLGRGIFKCFGCGAQGNVIDLVIFMERLDANNPQHVRQAALKLTEWFGLSTGRPQRDPPASRAPNATKPRCGNTTASSSDAAVGGTATPQLCQQHTPQARDHQAESGETVIMNAPLPFRLETLDAKHPYLVGRGFTPATIDRFGLGYCSRGMLRGRVAIPLHDAAGELVGYAGRLIDDALVSDQCPKYLFPGSRVRDGVRHEFHKSRLLYNAHRIGQAVDHLMVVEGFASVWWLTQCGFEKVVAVMGSSCSPEQGRLISDLVTTGGRITLLTDGDDAGVKCSLSLFEHIEHPHYIRWVRLSGGNQPTDFPPTELTVLLE